MDGDGWPPAEDEYLPRPIMQRLEALHELTHARSGGWENDTAQVSVWPYSDDIVEAVRERLAPLKAVVEPQDGLPRRLSGTER